MSLSYSTSVNGIEVRAAMPSEERMVDWLKADIKCMDNSEILRIRIPNHMSKILIAIMGIVCSILKEVNSSIGVLQMGVLERKVKASWNKKGKGKAQDCHMNPTHLAICVRLHTCSLTYVILYRPAPQQSFEQLIEREPQLVRQDIKSILKTTHFPCATSGANGQVCSAYGCISPCTRSQSVCVPWYVRIARACR